MTGQVHRFASYLLAAFTILTPSVGVAQICKVSVDDCHDTTGTFHVGVNWITGLTEAGCLGNPAASDYGYAEAVYAVCDLANHPAPSSTWPRRAKAEYVGDGTDTDRTTGVTYYPAIDPEDLPMRGRPVVGAIRFDYWDSGALRNGTHATGQAEFKDSLTKYESAVDDWQARLPFYATSNGQPIPLNTPRPLSGTLAFDSDSQSVVDQEILYASNKGLDHWSFTWWNRVYGVCSGDNETECEYNSTCQNASNGTCVGQPTSPPTSVQPLDPAYHWKDVVAHDRSLQLYLSSNYRDRMHFSLLIPVTRFGLFYQPTMTDTQFRDVILDSNPKSTWFEVNLEQWVELAKEPSYEKVLGDRPLLYLFGTDSFDWFFKGGNASADAALRTRLAMRRIRERFLAEGLGNPYIVGMEFTPWNGRGGAQDFYRSDEYGLDAVTTYAHPLGCTGGAATILYNSGTQKFATNPAYDPPDFLSETFGVLSQQRSYRQTTAEQDGKQLVPNASTGWDPRPEIIPVAYDGVQCDNPGTMDRIAVWAEHPSSTAATEIGLHLQDVLDWVAENPAQTEANAVSMYAWNEVTEGGWLVPTIGEGTSRLDAVRSVMCQPPDGPPQPGGSCGYQPVGNVGGATGGLLYGWAYDPDVANRSIEVAVYRDGPYGSGTLVTSAVADKPNAGVNALGVPGNHRFEFHVPPYLEGVSLYVHAIDPVRGSINPVLLNNGGADHVVHPVVVQCGDGIDNDGDSLIDTADSGCGSAADRSEQVQCSDGLDNDSDGKVDYARDFPPDPDCSTWGKGYEGNTVATNCANGLDDDADGFADQGVDLDSDGVLDTYVAKDGQCSGPNENSESCGLGFEAGVAITLVWFRLQRVRRRRGEGAA